MKEHRDKNDPYYSHDCYVDEQGNPVLWIWDNTRLHNRMRRNPAFDNDVWPQSPPASGKKVDYTLLAGDLRYSPNELVERTHCLYCDSVAFNVPKRTWLCPPCWRKHEREQWRIQTARYRARHRDKLPNECSHCKEPMTSQRKTKKYCSARCRVAANRAASQ